jgi:DNA mismatch repair protein MutS
MCAEQYGYTRPTYIKSESAGMSVEDLRHPILERVHTDTPYIPHTLSLGSHKTQEVGAEHGILLYGVNAAGKSSLSKAIGLAVLMAQIGMPVAASAMTLAPYNGLYTRILGNDNLWAGMSSFVVEMTELRTILGAGPRSLVLGDELCAGTETTSAIAIVGAGIQRLVEKNVQFFFATHLHELADVPEIAGIPTVKPYHLTVQSQRDCLVYDRKLKEGTGPAMYGLEVCKGLDMDPVFLELAVELRRKWEGAVDLAKVSRYNAAVPVQMCDACGSRTALETHHIVPQAAANQGGFVATGRHKNEKGNLVVLCGSCHDKHHAGDIEVRGWKATSVGRKLDLSRFTCPKVSK